MNSMLWTLLAFLATGFNQEASESVAQELLEQLKTAPLPDSAERELDLSDLFRQAGAAEENLIVQPIPEVSPGQLNAMKNQIEKNLWARGKSAADIETVYRMEAERMVNPGNNLIVTLPGKSKRNIVVCTSMDAAKESPGIVDNWTSCLMLVKLYQAMQTHGSNHTIIFVAFGAEELGCLGAKAFVKDLTKPVLRSIDAVVDLDCLGMAGPSVWHSSSSMGLILLARDVAKKQGFNLEVRDFEDVKLANSNAREFRASKLPVLFVEGLDPLKGHTLHTREETANLVEAATVDRTLRFLVELLNRFDQFDGQLTYQAVCRALGEVKHPDIARYKLFGPSGPRKVGVTQAKFSKKWASEKSGAPAQNATDQAAKSEAQGQQDAKQDGEKKKQIREKTSDGSP